jgi:hypothetical protein
MKLNAIGCMAIALDAGKKTGIVDVDTRFVSALTRRET